MEQNQPKNKSLSIENNDFYACYITCCNPLNGIGSLNTLSLLSFHVVLLDPP